MKRFGLHLVLELATTLVALGVVLALAFDGPTQTSALAGVALAGVLGLLALYLKSQVAGAGAQELKGLVAVQGLAFGGRLLALLLGGLVMKRQGLEPTAFVLAFFGVAMAQQAIEVRFMLSAHGSRAGAEVAR